MKLTLFFLFTLSFSCIFSQTDTIYYDSDWEIVTSKNKASFYRYTELDSVNNKFIAYDYFISNKIQMIANYADRDFLVKNGKATWYYENGNKKSEGNYIDGEKDGFWTRWYENGVKEEQGNYLDDKEQGIWELWYPNGIMKEVINYKNNGFIYVNRWSQNGTLQVENGNGKYFEYFDDGKIEIVGFIKNGLKHDVWETFDEEGVKKNTENYKEGKLVKGISYQNGKEYPYVHKEVMPYWKSCAKVKDLTEQYDCTLYEFSQWATGVTYLPEAIDNNIQGRCFVRFVVDVDGSIIDVSISKSSGYKLLDDEALNQIKSMPDLFPGVQQGIPVKVQFVVPINFKIN